MSLQANKTTGNPHGYNHSNYDGAVELARRLRAHWLDRGYNIRARIESLQLGEHSTIYCVRSSLRNGLPAEESRVLAMDEAA